MVAELEEQVEGPIARATERLETEIDRTSAEQRALRQFADEIRSLEIHQSSAGSDGLAVRTVAHERTGVLETIRKSYESTVMAVPHYELEYDDTYRESLEEEFGPEIALLLTRNRSIDGEQRTFLLEAIARSLRRREEFIEILNGERESIRRHDTELRRTARELSSLEEITAVAKTFGDYDGIRSRLLTLGTTLEEITRTRQERVFDRRDGFSLPIDGPTLPSYLYADLEYSYPILGTAVELEQRRGSLQARAEAGLAVTN